MKKTAGIMLSLILLAGCGSSEAAASASPSALSSPRLGCEWSSDNSCSFTVQSSPSAEAAIDAHVGEKADMSGYPDYDPDTTYMFVNSDVKNMIARMNNGDTFVTFFGFSSCPWCRDAMPILNAAAQEADVMVDYINTRLDPSWDSNLDLKDYDLLVDAIGDLFPTDDDGKQHLDVPFVVFFKDGKVVYSASYPQYDAHKETISPENAEIEKENYEAGFKAIA